MNRSKISRSQSIPSSQLSFTFIVDQTKIRTANILSFFNDKVLVSQANLTELFIYSREGRHLSTITINDNEKLFDVTWTPRGNILYTTDFPSNKVVVMSESGKVITTHTQMTDPRYLSVSNDDVVYLADFQRGVYQSTDDGVSWSLVFESTEGRQCWQVIKVNTDHSDDFWTLEQSGNKSHLRVYSIKRCSEDKVSWKDINVTTIDGKHTILSRSSLSYGNNMNIFLSDYYNKAVHVLSVNGQYDCQLLSSHHIKNKPCRLAVDEKRQLLYVGQDGRVIEAFRLSDGYSAD